MRPKAVSWRISMLLSIVATSFMHRAGGRFASALTGRTVPLVHILSA